MGTRRLMGFGRACFECGALEGARGVALKLCSRCNFALFCSRECMQATWRAGHKDECVAPLEKGGCMVAPPAPS